MNCSRSAASSLSRANFSSCASFRSVMSIAVPITRLHRPVSSNTPTAFGGDPADDTVFLADRAVFNVIEFAARRICRAGIDRSDTIAVIRMQPVVKIVHADGGIGGYAEHRFDARRPGQPAVAIFDIPPSDVGGFGRQPEPFLALSQLCLGRDAVRDVEALDEDASYRTCGIGNRLKDEIYEALIDRAAGYRLHHVFRAFGGEGGAGAVNPVEQVELTLCGGLGDRIGHGTAENIAIADQPEISGIGNLDDVLRAGQHRHE